MSRPTDRLEYCPCYCEENIWHLCGHPRFELIDGRVLCISNPRRACAFWAQRAADNPLEPVVWDYHVILVTYEPAGWLVWDLDTLLGFPLDLDTYLAGTFLPLQAGAARCTPRRGEGDEVLAPRFRAIDARTYRAEFSSDRSHMRDRRGRWLSAPPAWPAIYRPGAASFLSWTEMEEGGEEVLTLEQLKKKFHNGGLER